MKRRRKMKNLLFPIALSFFLIVAFSAAGAEEIPDLDVSGWTLNPAPVLGPEGIVLGTDGNIYMGGHDGRIWRVSQKGEMQQFADLNTLPGQREARISAVGVATDAHDDIYVATLDFNGGSVLKVVGPGKPDSANVSLFRSGIGMANFILIDKESATMYVSDSSMFSGRVFRFDMNDESKLGAAADEATELLGKFRYANGLALSPDKHWLYVAETTSGRISKINLETKETAVFAKLGGWTDGLYFEPSRRLLFACDNKGGRIAAVDSSGKVVGEVRLLGREGQCAPASLIFTDPDTIVFTDLWRASLLRALVGKPQYHSYAYRLNVDEIIK
jgi:sugar lactone lactonase YvrE